MGTHPIFESDFDCLTDIIKMINRIVNRKLTVSLFRQSIPLTSNPGPIQTLIATKLTSEFDPSVLVIKNESAKHGFRHGPESHFNVLIVSDSFDGAKPVKRQRMINSILKEEMKSMHALSCSIRTNSEYDDHDAPHKTPNCAGKS